MPFLVSLPQLHLLFVPVVDLVNVSKHNLVFASHVIRNPLLLHPAHVALWMQKVWGCRYQGNKKMDGTPMKSRVRPPAPPTGIGSLPVLVLHSSALRESTEKSTESRGSMTFYTNAWGSDRILDVCSYLHDGTQVSNVVSLGFDQLQEDKAARERIKTFQMESSGWIG